LRAVRRNLATNAEMQMIPTSGIEAKHDREEVETHTGDSLFVDFSMKGYRARSPLSKRLPVITSSRVYRERISSIRNGLMKIPSTASRGRACTPLTLHLLSTPSYCASTKTIHKDQSITSSRRP